MSSRHLLARTTALLAIFALVLAGCGGGEVAGGPDGDAGTAVAGDAGTAADDGTLTIASLVDNNSYDPVELRLGHYIQYWMPVYDTLLMQDSSTELEPHLASEWTYNDDQTVLTLTLRDDVTFSDGEPFNAEAVQANIEHQQAGGGQFAYMTALIEEVVPVSDTEVELHLSQPDPGLIYNLAVVAGAMASPAALEGEGIATSPVGSGPYLLDADRTTAGRQYVYTRNPDYWNPDDYPFDELVLTPITDNTARLNALQSGEADTGLVDIPSAAAAEEAGLNVQTSAVDWQGLVIADRAGDDAEPLGNVQVRQAINMAFDRKAIVDQLLDGQGTPTAQIFNPVSTAYVEELDDAYTYDPEGARELLAEAGYPDGFEITMPEIAGFGSLNPVVAQQLGEIGVTVKYETIAADSTISELLSGRFPLYFFSLGSQDAWNDFEKVVAPAAPWNTSKSEDPELAELLQTAREAVPEAQEEAFQAVNRWLVDNAWFAPTYRANTIIATNDTVEVIPHRWFVAPWIRDYAPVG